MGSYDLKVPPMSDTLEDILTYDNKLYALATDYNETYQVLYTLNNTEDGWDTVVVFPFYSLGLLGIFDGKLLIYPRFKAYWDANYIGNIYRLNGSHDGVELVVDDPTRTSFQSKVEYHGKLYTSAIDHNTSSYYIVRLNSTGDAWDTIYDSTPMGFVASLLVYQDRLYIFLNNFTVYKTQLWVLNTLENDIEYLFDLSSNITETPYISSIAYDGNMYYLGYQVILRVDFEEERPIPVYYDQTYTETKNILIYKGLLHVSGRKLIRSNEPATGSTQLTTLTDIKSSAIFNGRLYFTRDYDNSLFVYSTITSVSIASNKTVGMVSSPVKLFSMGNTDYPATYQWDFGDTGSSTLENPEHTYTVTNTYDITLTVTCEGEVKSATVLGYLPIYDYFHKYIYTIEDLQLIGSGPSWPDYGEYELANDIDASATTGWSGGYGLGFAPITMFRGILNGANFTISNLFMDSPSDAAIFLSVEGASFLNLNFEDVDIRAYNHCSTLFMIGVARGPQDISNCHIAGIFSGYYIGVFAYSSEYYIYNSCSSSPEFFDIQNPEIAGIVITSRGCDFINCQSTFVAHATYSSIGGICLFGDYSNGTLLRYNTISGCHCSIDATGYYVGGLAVGFEGIVTDSHVDGYIRSAQYGGGLVVWYNAYGNSENLYSHCDVIGDQNQTGGLFGTVTARVGSITLTNCYATGDVRSYYRVGGIVGESDLVSYINCYATGDIGVYFCGGLVGDIGEGSCINCFATGDVRGNYCVGGLVGYFGSGGDIFNSYSLGNVTYGALPDEYTYSYSNSESVGGFIGRLSSHSYRVANCFSTGEVSQHPGTTSNIIRDIGGFVGVSYGGFYVDCYSFGSAIGKVNIGGFIGYFSPGGVPTGTERCFSMGDATTLSGSEDSYTGGFIGIVINGNDLAIIKNCFSRGNVISYSFGINRYIGGFIGSCEANYGYTTEVVNCYSTGSVSEIVE